MFEKEDCMSEWRRRCLDDLKTRMRHQFQWLDAVAEFGSLDLSISIVTSTLYQTNTQALLLYACHRLLQNI
jgi:hypothetical protein